jgi:hypothetical protein
VFGGDCAPTLSRLVVERADGRFFARERPEDIAAPLPDIDYDTLMFDPGDLVVTRDSLEGRYDHTNDGTPDALRGHIVDGTLQAGKIIFLCEEHRSLTGNPSFQDNLLYTLFEPGSA